MPFDYRVYTASSQRVTKREVEQTAPQITCRPEKDSEEERERARQQSVQLQCGMHIYEKCSGILSGSGLELEMELELELESCP